MTPPGFLWLWSPIGEHVHLFDKAKIRPDKAVAVCGHDVPTGLLRNQAGENCMGCMLTLGELLAERQAEQHRRTFLETQRGLADLPRPEYPEEDPDREG